jgi:uncharacterized membrane protein YbhN (UPF0104 family)
VNKILRLVISVVLLGWLASRTDWGQVGETFGQLRLAWWLGAVGLYVAIQVVSAFRWQVVARPLGFRQSLAAFTGFYFIGMFFNLFLPTSVGGDVVRAWYLDGGTGRRLSAFLSAFVDRFSGLLLLLGLACVAAAFCPPGLPAWICYSAWGTGACALVALIMLPAVARWTGRFARIRRLSQDARLYLQHPRLLFWSGVLSLIIQAANVVVVWMVGRALGAVIPWNYYCVFVPMVTLLTLLPVSLNGMGVREGGTVLFLAPLGLAQGTALSLAFLTFAVYGAASLLGGGVYLAGCFPDPKKGSAKTGSDPLNARGLTPFSQSPLRGPNDHESVHRDSDQGRTGQLNSAA